MLFRHVNTSQALTPLDVFSSKFTKLGIHNTVNTNAVFDDGGLNEWNLSVVLCNFIQ